MTGHVKDSAKEDAGEKEYFCGIGKCKPKWMQVTFRNSKFLCFILSLYSTLQGALVTGM